MTFTRAGYQIWYEPKCTIYHKESQATGQNSPLRTYFITHNRLLLVKRNPKEFIQPLAYLYLFCIVAFRDILKYSVTARFDLTKATIRALRDFICKKHSQTLNTKP